MRTTQAELTEDMQSFLLLADRNCCEMGTPECPLCNNAEADYRNLTDRIQPSGNNGA